MEGEIMQTWEFKCPKCEKFYDRICSYENIGNQKCEKCGELLKRIYSSFGVNGFPTGWSTFNNPDIAKPRTDLERQRQREFYENSEPYH